VRVLLTASQHARLLVLGSHGHSHIHNAVLGSVSRECVRQARCPALIIPAPHTAKTNEPAKPAPAIP
jgi:nucleotide-binding universal stress UspA family protein